MLSRRSRSSRRGHNPLNHREVPQATEETLPVAGPPSSWVETTFSFVFVFFKFHSNAFLFFQDKPHHHHHNSLPPHQSVIFLNMSYSPISQALPLSHPWTFPHPAVLSHHPQTFLSGSFFSIKIRKLSIKALYVSRPSPNPFSRCPRLHFSPSCSASRLLGKAWRLACPSIFPIVNGKGKKIIKKIWCVNF